MYKVGSDVNKASVSSSSNMNTSSSTPTKANASFQGGTVSAVSHQPLDSFLTYKFINRY